MSAYKIIKNEDNEATLVDSAKRIRLTPEDYDRLLKKADVAIVDEPVMEETNETTFDHEQVEEFVPYEEYEDPAKDDIETEEFEKIPEVVVDDIEYAPDDRFVVEETTEEPTIEEPIVEESVEEAEDSDPFEEEYKPTSEWKEAGEATYSVPDIPVAAASMTNYVSASRVDTADYFKKLRGSDTLSPTSKKVLNRRLDEYDSLEANLSALTETIDKAKETIKGLNDEKNIRKSGKVGLEKFVVSKLEEIDLDEIRKYADQAGVSLDEEIKLFEDLYKKINSKLSNVDESIDEIDKKAEKEESILEELNNEEKEMIVSKNTIISGLQSELRSAAEADELESETVKEEEAYNKKIAELKAQRDQILASLPMLEEEEPKRVVGIVNKFPTPEENKEGYAKVA